MTCEYTRHTKCEEKSEKERERGRKKKKRREKEQISLLGDRETMRKGRNCASNAPPATPRFRHRVVAVEIWIAALSRGSPRLVGGSDDFARPRLKARLVHAPVVVIRES